MRAEEERERQKRQRQREHAKRRSLQGLQNDARKRTKDFEKRVSYWERRVVRGVFPLSACIWCTTYIEL